MAEGKIKSEIDRRWKLWHALLELGGPSEVQPVLLRNLRIYGGAHEAIGPIAHICLDVKDPDSCLDRARAMDVPVIRVSRGDAWVTSIRDPDGNLFEIKKEIGS